MSSILVENGTKELAKFVGICLWAFSGANIYIYIYIFESNEANVVITA